MSQATTISNIMEDTNKFSSVNNPKKSNPSNHQMVFRHRFAFQLKYINSLYYELMMLPIILFPLHFLRFHLTFYGIDTQKLLWSKQGNVQLRCVKCFSLQHPNYHAIKFRYAICNNGLLPQEPAALSHSHVFACVGQLSFSCLKCR